MHYPLDPEQSTLSIHASSSVHPIETRSTVTGWIDCTVGADGRPDPGQPITGQVEFSLGAMRSGNPLIDREAERRLDVRRHPTVTATLSRLEPDDEDGTWRGEGSLTFHGVTGHISGTLQIDPSEAGLRLEGSAEIDVTDFGVQPPSLLLVKVHKEVRVDLRAIAEAG